MGSTVEDPDVIPVKMDKKKSKKKSNKTSHGNAYVEINSVLPDEKVEKKKKKKRKLESNEDGDDGNLEDNGDLQKKNKKKRKREGQDDENDPNPKKEKKKKHKHRTHERNLEIPDTCEKIKKKKKKRDNKNSEAEKTVENNSKKPKKKTKKVSFSSDVEIFPSQNTKKRKTKKTTGDGLVRGKRFTPEEDEIVKQAVNNYIISNNLGDDGLQMILNCRLHKGMNKCWQEIGSCIPYRPYTAIYYRAHILFEQSEHRVWTPEEIKFLKESHAKHGNKWKMIAEELGKHRFHVKDTWRRIKFDNLKNGKWSQDEYQNLYDMVNLDLQMKITGQEKKSKHGMLRDNIPWTAISEKLSTRSDATCCRKWYEQLTSSLVAEKKWSDADDYWLVGRLYEIDAACVEDVDWDNVLEHRSGDICRKRWDQMVVCIGNHKGKTFGEQVEILAKRYRPELAETRQIWDDKPLVP